MAERGAERSAAQSAALRRALGDVDLAGAARALRAAIADSGRVLEQSKRAGRKQQRAGARGGRAARGGTEKCSLARK